MVVLGDRFAEAVAYASQVHASQVRKGTDIPYVSHLLAVAGLVLEAGGEEDLAIAGLLHDAAEDHGGEARLADIEARFGARVAGIVRDCSDSLESEGDAKADWETRKREHLAHLPGVDDDTLLVWMADKTHNARSIVTDLRIEGAAAMTRFKATPDRVLWYYRANLDAARTRYLRSDLLVPLTVAVEEMAALLVEVS